MITPEMTPEEYDAKYRSPRFTALHIVFSIAAIGFLLLCFMACKTGFIGIFGLVGMIIGTCLETWFGYLVFRFPRLASCHQILGTLTVMVLGTIVYVVTANLDGEWNNVSVMAVGTQGAYVAWGIVTVVWLRRMPKFLSSAVGPGELPTRAVDMVSPDVILEQGGDMPCDLGNKSLDKFGQSSPVFVSPFESGAERMHCPTPEDFSVSGLSKEVLEVGNLPGSSVAFPVEDLADGTQLTSV